MTSSDLRRRQAKPGLTKDAIRRKCLARMKRERAAKVWSKRLSGTSPPTKRVSEEMSSNVRQVLEDVVQGELQMATDFGGAEGFFPCPESSSSESSSSSFLSTEWMPMTPEEEAALVEEIGAELRAWEEERALSNYTDELEAEEQFLASAGEAYDAEDADEVLCPICQRGYLGYVTTRQDCAIECKACGIRLNDKHAGDALDLDDLRMLLAKTLDDHANTPCDNKPSFFIDPRFDTALLHCRCLNCDFYATLM